MLRYKTVKLPFATSGQETELVYSFNLGARTTYYVAAGHAAAVRFRLSAGKIVTSPAAVSYAY